MGSILSGEHYGDDGFGGVAGPAFAVEMDAVPADAQAESDDVRGTSGRDGALEHPKYVPEDAFEIIAGRHRLASGSFRPGGEGHGHRVLEAGFADHADEILLHQVHKFSILDCLFAGVGTDRWAEDVLEGLLFGRGRFDLGLDAHIQGQSSAMRPWRRCG